VLLATFRANVYANGVYTEKKTNDDDDNNNEDDNYIYRWTDTLRQHRIPVTTGVFQDCTLK